MELVNIDLSVDKLSDHKDTVENCKNVIFENLEINGGSLKQDNILDL